MDIQLCSALIDQGGLTNGGIDVKTNVPHHDHQRAHHLAHNP